MKGLETVVQSQLSNGDTIKITCLGRKYNFVKIHYADQAPDCTNGVSMDTARKLFANAIKSDVLEVEHD